MTDTRFRLVVMGDSYVGKSSIIKRFLYGTFNIDYVATVEDLFSQDFEVGGTCLKVDILDTAGDAQFPAMRRYIDIKGGIQQLRGQNFAIFCPPPPCVDSFYTLSVDKNRHFLTPSPPHLVHVVIECPQKEISNHKN